MNALITERQALCVFRMTEYQLNHHTRTGSIAHIVKRDGTYYAAADVLKVALHEHDISARRAIKHRLSSTATTEGKNHEHDRL
jgi:hypothetical protein